ncbi:phosphate regulon sensor histidine kinase PhoR [Rhodoferax sp.]|jgi:two-component system phosphate regulon sensor histidine kinase PhoR|uniref:phosphate regulon sensor histidine kinase PhoR n=1 Tax=Rhodoferax sp. TaxID=50421 RepID=UPI003784B036
MVWRLLPMLAFQLAPAVAVRLFGGADTSLSLVLLAALAGGGAWVVIDGLQGARLMRWLRAENPTELPSIGGSWGEMQERIRRLLLLRERAVRENDTRLQDFLAALQASPNGVVLLDADKRIEWFNQTASDHFGLDSQRDLLQHFGNLVRDPGFAGYFTAGDFRHDVQMPGRNSTTSRPVNLSVHLHPYGEGRSLLLSRDITAKEQAEAMRRDFVANVSHEIRTPLTVLAGFVETLQTLNLQEAERERYLDLMSQQAHRMQTLVSDLLTLSRLEGSPLPSAFDWVSVPALMAQCEQDAMHLSCALWMEPHVLDFSATEASEIAGSASELQSAMSNLIGNAVRYSPADQRVEIAWTVQDDGSAVFSVRDHGAGIAAEHVPRLTERFYRVDRSRSRETGGTGLGLAIVKHVSQRHGAELLIESTPGKGSTFSIHFPARRVRPMATVRASAELIDA